MKSLRDIRLVGIGFLLGMVFCYFVIATKPIQPQSATMTAAFTTAPAATNAPAVRFVNTPPEATKERHVPVRRMDIFQLDAPNPLRGPAGERGAKHDLIDFKYVPDFKLPPD